VSRVPPDSYLVQGGRPLKGTLQPAGSKNAALPELAATLLTDRPVTIRNLPKIRDVQAMMDILRSLGASVERQDGQSVRITARNIDTSGLDMELCRRIRASILLAGPLLARCGSLRLPPPGGDVIGRRRLDTHFIALKRMGASVDFDGTYIALEANGLRGVPMLLDEPSVTATENALMAAAAAAGTTTIYNAACEPNVQDLARMLTSMGARISGAGTNRMVVEGRDGLLECAGHSVSPDHIEIGSFLGLAACCGDGVRIPDVPRPDIEPTVRVLGRLGLEVAWEDDDIFVPGGQDLHVVADMGNAIPTIYDAPWPGFSPDLTSTAVVLATQARGTVLIFEKMFESRLFFVDKLVSMGARIIQCDPHRVVVSGPAMLHGTRVSSPDIRAGMALLTAALCAEGESIIGNVHQIERGYERLVERLGALGAEISRGPEA